MSLRVHCLPLRVSNDEVVSWALDTFAEEVLDISFEKVGRRDGQQVMSFVRTLTVILKEGCDKDTDIPYRYKLTTSEGGFTVLISVKNRRPECLRCGVIGHIRAECKALWCSICRSFGSHTFNTCPRHVASFATAIQKHLNSGSSSAKIVPQERQNASGEDDANNDGWQQVKSKGSKRSSCNISEEATSVANRFESLNVEDREAPKEQRPVNTGGGTVGVRS